MKFSKPLALALTTLMLLIPTCAALTFENTPIVYQDGDGLGSLSFTYDVSASRAVLGATDIRFYNLKHGAENTFGTIGFTIDENATLLMTSITPGLITLTYTGNGTCIIYAPGKGMPSSVTGVDSWDYSHADDTVTFTRNTDSTISIDYGVNLDDLQVEYVGNLSFLNLGIFVLIAGVGVMFMMGGVDAEALIKIVMIAGTIGILIFVVSAIIMNV